jgi:hypothetical protein
MPDIVVTVPKALWQAWLAEGDLPGQPAVHRSHFWIAKAPLPECVPGDRVYIVSHGRLRGYAPLVSIEQACSLRPERACLMREGGAVAVTIAMPIRGFQGWRYVGDWWKREDEIPFPEWKTEGVIMDVRL